MTDQHINDVTCQHCEGRGGWMSVSGWRTCSSCGGKGSAPSPQPPTLAEPQPSGAAMRVDDEPVPSFASFMDCMREICTGHAVDRIEDYVSMLVRDRARLRTENAALVAENVRLGNLEWKFPHKLDVEPDGSLWQHDDAGLRKCTREQVVAWLNRFGELERAAGV